RPGPRLLTVAAGGRGARRSGLGEQPRRQGDDLLSRAAGGIPQWRYRACVGGCRQDAGVTVRLKKTAPARTARCDDPPPPGLLEGIEQFNRQEFRSEEHTSELQSR